MKTKLTFIAIVFSALISCEKEKEAPIPEVPQEIIRTEVSPILFNRIVELLPGATNMYDLYPSLFTDTIQKKIVLTRESEVYITFVSEKALFKNTVGWYSYPAGKPPKSADEVNFHLLFPNVSGKGEGGELLQGDMLQLGDTTFTKGTVIGFFLIIRGWQDGYINYSNPIHFTDSQLNKDSKQYHLLFKEKNIGHIILGFEDMEYGQGDNDFNDILFVITDNQDGLETISFDMNKLPVL